MNNTQQNTKIVSRETEERALLESVASGDRDALTDLYTRYYGRLFKFVFRLTRSYSRTEEVVNDIMLAIWRSAKNYRGASKPSTWIFGIAYRQALKRLSRKKLKIAANLDVDQLAESGANTVEREDWVQSGLDALSATQRLAVELVFYVGLSYEEVAEVTDCPVNTVKTRMFHARKKLRKQLVAVAGEFPTGEEM